MKNDFIILLYRAVTRHVVLRSSTKYSVFLIGILQLLQHYIKIFQAEIKNLDPIWLRHFCWIWPKLPTPVSLLTIALMAVTMSLLTITLLTITLSIPIVGYLRFVSWGISRAAVTLLSFAVSWIWCWLDCKKKFKSFYIWQLCFYFIHKSFKPTFCVKSNEIAMLSKVWGKMYLNQKKV